VAKKRSSTAAPVLVHSASGPEDFLKPARRQQSAQTLQPALIAAKE